jgi:hypothetical protein
MAILLRTDKLPDSCNFVLTIFTYLIFTPCMFINAVILNRYLVDQDYKNSECLYDDWISLFCLFYVSVTYMLTLFSNVIVIRKVGHMTRFLRFLTPNETRCCQMWRRSFKQLTQAHNYCRFLETEGVNSHLVERRYLVDARMREQNVTRRENIKAVTYFEDNPV